MKHSLIKNLTTNAPLKIVALILGYGFWSLASNCYTTERWFEVPLCFFGTPSHLEIEAPETISILISGSRVDLAHLDTNHLAVHINSHDLSQGTHEVTFSQEQLLLPKIFTVTHWNPSNLTVAVKEITHQG